MSGSLQAKYKDEVVPALQKQFNYGNPMQIPRLTKIIVNIGVDLAYGLADPRIRRA